MESVAQANPTWSRVAAAGGGRQVSPKLGSCELPQLLHPTSCKKRPLILMRINHIAMAVGEMARVAPTVFSVGGKLKLIEVFIIEQSLNF